MVTVVEDLLALCQRYITCLEIIGFTRNLYNKLGFLSHQCYLPACPPSAHPSCFVLLIPTILSAFSISTCFKDQTLLLPLTVDALNSLSSPFARHHELLTRQTFWPQTFLETDRFFAGTTNTSESKMYEVVMPNTEAPVAADRTSSNHEVDRKNIDVV